MSGHVHNMAYIKFTMILRLGTFVHYLYFVICFRTLSKTQDWTILNWSIFGLGIINPKSFQDILMHAFWEEFGLFLLLRHTWFHPCPLSQRHGMTTF